jgi:glycosyltransferase involved in cell wall biosynthesis
MRVLHWFPNYLHGGGVANAVTALANAQADEGIAVGIAAVEHEEAPMYGRQVIHAGVDLLRWQPSWGWRIGDLLIRKPTSESAATLRNWNPDIVHVHAEFAPDNIWAVHLFNCPLVLSFHGALHPEVFRKSKTFRKRLYVVLARHLLYRRVDLFHALSPAEAGHIAAILPGQATVVIPIGPVACPATGAGEESATRLRTGRGLRVLYVGRLDRYTKGLDLLVAAFAVAKQAAGDALGTLTLVGPDWRDGRKSIEEQVSTLGLGASVILAGGVSTSSVNRFLKDSDIYVQLSRHDAFPLSVVDALVSGLPTVISSAVGTTSYSEISSLSYVRVVHPDIEEAAAALTDLTAHYSDVTGAARRAREQMLDFFSWNRIARCFVEAYQTLS